MEVLSEVLPIFVYTLLCGFLIICIIIGVKLIKTMNKVQMIVDDVEKKVNSLNGIFSVIEMTSNKVATIYDRLISGVWAIVDKFISKKERKDEDE